MKSDGEIPVSMNLQVLMNMYINVASCKESHQRQMQKFT